MNERPKILGVTGPIGAGKSAAARLLAARGIPTFDADAIAKKIMSEQVDVREKIKKHFGDDAYAGEQLNTKKLAQIIFHDAGKREILNSIVHPPTLERIDDAAKKLNAALVAVESALIFSSRIEFFFDYILLVEAPKKKLVERLQKNRSMSEEEISARLASQSDFSKFHDEADFIIENSGTLEELESKVAFVLTIINADSAQSEPNNKNLKSKI